MVIAAALAEKQVMDNSAVIDDARAYFNFGMDGSSSRNNLPLHFARAGQAKRAAIKAIHIAQCNCRDDTTLECDLKMFEAKVTRQFLTPKFRNAGSPQRLEKNAIAIGTRSRQIGSADSIFLKPPDANDWLIQIVGASSGLLAVGEHQ